MATAVKKKAKAKVQPVAPTPVARVVEQTTFPDTVLVKQIDRKSAEWTKYHFVWEQMDLLYVGGADIEAKADQFLKKRPKEMPDVFQSRVERFNYQNHVGTAVDWYMAALFETPPTVEEAGLEPPPPPKPAATNLDSAGKPLSVEMPPEVKGDPYYDALELNCDRAGTPLLEHQRNYFKDLLLFGRAVTLVDLPKAGDYANALEEKEAGALDPYLVQWNPRQMINYGFDEHGNLSWVIFYARAQSESGPFNALEVKDCWYYFDKKRFATYERVVPEEEYSINGKSAPDDAAATLVADGPHALADQGVVPVIYKEIPKGLWLMNRAYSPAKNHLNTDNVLDWALTMAALAMPVVQMDGEFQVTLSEAGFIKLPFQSKYSWAEPNGNSFKHLAERAATVKEEIFRAFYLISQARSSSATPQAQSGVSKQQDYSASKKVLNLFGDVMRITHQQTLNMVSAARTDDKTWDVRGMTFSEGPPSDELDMIAAAQAIQVPSVIFEKQLYRRTVDITLTDINPKLKDQIYAQIDAGPTAADAETALLKTRADSLMAKSAMPAGSI